MDATTFERKFIELITDKISVFGLSHSAIARKVFPNVEDPVRKWRRIRTTTKKGLPQPLTFAEAYVLAKEANADLASVALEVREILKLEEKQNPQAKPLKRKNQGCF